jgi:hypothetical protein
MAQPYLQGEIVRIVSVKAGILAALIALLAQVGSALSRSATMTWPDAVAQLTAERTKAETCVALFKRYGNDAQLAGSETMYTQARADSEAVIAGLTTVLSMARELESLTSLQTRLRRSASGLQEFCDSVSKVIPKTDGQKGVLADLAKVLPQAALLKMLSDGVSALYTNHRDDDALTRATIKTQLEAARWPAFSEVKAAQ